MNKKEAEKYLPPARTGGKSYAQYQDVLKRCRAGEVVNVLMIEGGIVCMDRRLFQGFGCTLSAEQIKGALARAYCHEYNSEKTTDPVLMEVMTDELLKVMRAGFMEEVPV